MHEGGIGLCLTGLMIMVFLGNIRATVAVFLSIPLSALATFLFLSFGDNSINSMVLGGLALAFSRLIDNSVVVLENIFRHLEMGEPPEVAAEKGGAEVALPVLAATLTTVVVFFPVTFLYGVSQFLFTALALSVVLSLFASYIVAMTVVPLFCAKLIKGHAGPGGGSPGHASYDSAGPAGTPMYADASRPLPTALHRDQSAAANGTDGHDPHTSAVSDRQVRGAPAAAEKPRGWSARFNDWFNERFNRFLDWFDGIQAIALARPVLTIVIILGLFLLSFLLMPFVGLAYFPRTDPGQFVVTVKAPTGMRVEMTEQEVAKVEDLIRRVVPKDEIGLIVSNIGVTADFSAIYTSNSASHTAFVQTSLKEGHKIGSYEYMDRVRAAMRKELPELTTYFQSGGLVDAVLNLGLPAPIDVQVSATNLTEGAAIAAKIARRAAALGDVSDVLVPQDVDAPALKLDVDRLRVGELGLNEKEVVGQHYHRADEQRHDRAKLLGRP